MAICIQVRAFVPMKGVYKGMLMKKVIVNGPKIQFPESMRKVEASICSNRSDKGCLLICQAGLDPSKNSQFMGRLPSIDPSLKPPPASFQPKELGSMITRLIRSLQVPEDAVRTYTKASTRTKKTLELPKISHAYVES